MLVRLSLLYFIFMFVLLCFIQEGYFVGVLLKRNFQRRNEMKITISISDYLRLLSVSVYIFLRICLCFIAFLSNNKSGFMILVLLPVLFVPSYRLQ